jgi:hypothetical protein
LLDSGPRGEGGEWGVRIISRLNKAGKDGKAGLKVKSEKDACFNYGTYACHRSKGVESYRTLFYPLVTLLGMAPAWRDSALQWQQVIDRA